MRVPPIGSSVRMPGRIRRAPGDFSVADAETPAVFPTLAAALSGLQEAPGTALSEADRRGLAQGRDVLDALHRLQAGLLDGSPDGAEVSAALDRLGEGASPSMAGLLAAVRVRALVVVTQLACRGQLSLSSRDCG